MLFYILAALVGTAFATPGVKQCLTCASMGLMENWALTGYPTQPSTMTYSASCGDAVITQDKLVALQPCSTAYCIEMLIPLGNSYEVLRGCHGDFAGSNPNYTLTKAQCTSYKTGSGVNLLSVCDVDDTATGCNNKFLPADVGTITTAECGNVAPGITCIRCSSFDGSGKCSSGEKTTDTGPHCVKTAGKVNGRSYVERSPSFLIASEKDTFCLPNKYTDTIYYGPGFGTNASRVKRALNQVFDGQSCFCKKDRCNSAPTTVIGTSLSLVALLVALPFFC